MRVSITSDLTITAEVDGIELHATLEELEAKEEQEKDIDSRTPRHRKTARRIPSSSAHDPGGHAPYSHDEAHIPTAQDLAASFLDVEPVQEKQELEAAMLSQSRTIDESIVSDTSDETAMGTGNALGLPGFLAAILQSIIDRLTVRIKNVNIKCDASLPSVTPGDPALSIGLSLTIACINVHAVTSAAGPKAGAISEARIGCRLVALDNISLDIICDASTPAQSSCSSLPLSPTLVRSLSPMSVTTPGQRSPFPSRSSVSSYPDLPSIMSGEPAQAFTSAPTTPTFERPTLQPLSPISVASTLNSNRGRFADAEEDRRSSSPANTDTSEIRPGEDSHSYSSRRSFVSSDDTDALYRSTEFPQDLSASVAEFQSSVGSLSDHLPTPSFLAGLPQDDDTGSLAAEETSPGISGHIMLQDHYEELNHSRTSSPPSDDESDPMAQSVMYSNEMGQSMYLSAISQDSPQSPEHTQAPGYFTSSPEYKRAPGYFPDDSDTEPLAQSTPTIRSTEEDLSDQEDRAPTPTGCPERNNNGQRMSSNSFPGIDPASPTQPDTNRVHKRLLSLDVISIWLPGVGSPVDTTDHLAQSTVFDNSPQNAASASAYARNMPGTFSAYAEMGASRRLQASYMQDLPSVSDLGAEAFSGDRALEIDFGVLYTQADISAVNLLTRTAAIATSGAPINTPPQKKGEQQVHKGVSPKLSIRLRLFRVALLESLAESLEPFETTSKLLESEQSKMLVHMTAKDLSFGLTPRSGAPDITFAIRRLAIGVDKKDILFFKKSEKTRTPDILIKVQSSKMTLQNQPITDARVWLRPIHIILDIPAIDEALGSFGGLSGIMEMSASRIASDQGQVNTSASPPRRGVRFEEDVKPPPSNTSGPELKLDISISGANLALKSHTCALELQCSTIKTSVRPKCIVMTVGNAYLYEASVDKQTKPSRFTVNAKDFRLDYLHKIEDTDLERLISLITPSKDKYENDDDILVDTLLRQRRKGAVLRVRLASVQIDVNSWAVANDLQTLGDELSKFAAVTKYLPEDDRPGLLILPRITDLNARLPINDHFGTLEVSLKEVQAAHIGLPALLAVSVGGIRAGPLGGLDIIHEIRATEPLPLLMMRMVGDEAEPTVKIKLFNLCFEYSVPTIMSLSGMDAPMETEKVVHDLATSILNIAAVNIEPSLPSPVHPSEGRSSRKVALDILVHDCAIGLKPQNSRAKGMFVLSNTKLSAVVPPEDTFSATLELRKSSLYITDRESASQPSGENISRQPIATDRLASHLIAQGFVSVSSIMAAQAVFTITDLKDTESRSVDLELRDELFLLETCADSTQTLIAILNGLSPPAPPSEAPKFRTEIMTLPEMLASFTGDEAVEERSSETNTLFDADERSPPSELDELLNESGMTEGLHIPVDASMNLEEDHAIFEGDRYDTQTVQSFIEEEGFFEIMESPINQRLSNDALWESVQKQSLCHGGGGAATKIKAFHFDDRHLDRVDSSVLGDQYRFNTPAIPLPVGKMTQKTSPFPLQVRVRDVHVIWNLYDGYDWEETRDTIAEAVEEVEKKLEQRKQRRRRSTEPDEEDESVIGDCLFNSIYIGVPANRDATDLRREISHGIDDLVSESESYATSGTSRPTQYSTNRQGKQVPRRRKLRLTRSKTHKIAFELQGVSVDFSLHPPDSGEVQSSVDIRLRDFEIFDNVPTSTWRKFLTYYHDEENMREMMKPMIHLEVLNIRPVPELTATELSLRVSLSVHAVQDTLLTEIGFNPATAPSCRSRCPRLHNPVLRIQARIGDCFGSKRPTFHSTN